MTRLVTGGPSMLDTLGAALWAEDSGGRELEDPGSLAKVRGALQDASTPEGELFYRRENEHYGQAAERAAADIIVDDDCESIDGPAQMTYPSSGRIRRPEPSRSSSRSGEELTISRLTLKNSGRIEKVHGRLNVGSTNYHPDKFA